MTLKEKKAIQKAIVMCDENVIDGFYYWDLLRVLEKVPTEDMSPLANLCPYKKEADNDH